MQSRTASLCPCGTRAHLARSRGIERRGQTLRQCVNTACCAAFAFMLFSTTSMAALPTADAITAPLDNKIGDAIRGRALVANKHLSLCLLCHQAPIAEEKFQGSISTDLAAVGARWTAAQIRSRLVAPRSHNPKSIMPAYHRTTNLKRVHMQWRGKPILDAQQIEDVIAYLVTLK